LTIEVKWVSDISKESVAMKEAPHNATCKKTLQLTIIIDEARV
jgi:hypothetical protein